MAATVCSEHNTNHRPMAGNHQQAWGIKNGAHKTSPLAVPKATNGKAVSERFSQNTGPAQFLNGFTPTGQQIVLRAKTEEATNLVAADGNIFSVFIDRGAHNG